MSAVYNPMGAESPKFLVLSLPRSRSAWLAHFLRYSGKVVGHDLATECGSVREFREKMNLMDGSCETGAVLGWRLLKQELPGVRLVVVKRDWRDVGRSLMAFGLTPPWDDLLKRGAMLDLVAALPGTLALEYSALADPAVCRMLFEHCLELPFDYRWWAHFNTLNIQVDMQARLNWLHSNHSKLEAFKAEVAERSKLENLRCLN